MKKLRKQLLLLAALLALAVVLKTRLRDQGLGAGSSLDGESRFRFGGYGRLYDDGIPDYRSGTDGRFSS